MKGIIHRFGGLKIKMKKTAKFTKSILMKFMLCALLLAIFGGVLVSCSCGGAQVQEKTISGITIKNDQLTPLSADNEKILEHFNGLPNDDSYKSFVSALYVEAGKILETAKSVLPENLKESLKSVNDIKEIAKHHVLAKIKEKAPLREYISERVGNEEKLGEITEKIAEYDNGIRYSFLTVEDVEKMVSSRDITGGDLDKIATLIYNGSYKNAANETVPAYDRFVAAYRGYDVVDSNANSGDFKEQKPIKLSAAKTVIEKAAGDNIGSYKSIIEKLTEEDVETIVMKLRSETNVDVNKKDEGIFYNIQLWIGKALGWITKYLAFGNYIIGICIIAIVFEIILLPLSIKQQKSSIKAARIRPKEMAIRKKYAGRTDQATIQKMQQEIMDLQQRENVSPMSGCLPLLVQFPIIIVLYNAVIDPLKYVLGMSSEFSGALQTFATASRAAGGLGLAKTNGTIGVLSAVKDNLAGLGDSLFINNAEEVSAALAGKNIPSFNIGPVNLGLSAGFSYEDSINYLLLLIPVLTFVVYYFSMKLTRKFTYQSTLQDTQQMGCSGKIMDISMPLMSVFFTFIVPGAVGVYWIFKSIVGTVKQFILSKLMPLPVFTEEDFKAAEKELNAKSPKKKTSKDPNAPRVRSLHYIDDEDDEMPADVKPEPKEQKETIETPFEKAPIKKDKKPKSDKTTEETKEEK